MRRVFGLAVAWAVASVLAAAQGQAQSSSEPVSGVAIPPQPLASALQHWASQSGWQLMYDSGFVGDQQSNGVPAGLPAIDGLRRILEGTGLEYQFLNDRTISLLPIGRSTNSAYRATPVRLANAAPDLAASPQTSDEGSGRNSGSGRDALQEVTEVLVTAQKRSENLQDVPVPVTALNASSLVEGNQVRLQDYYTQVPGLSFTPRAFGEPSIAIRGVTADYGGNPAVGITVDDIPFGASTGLGGGLATPDFDPSDLQRIEVLRGPQGTLYGASSLGGLLKFVTADPSTSGFSGRVQGGISTVSHGNDVGYNLRGAANIPLSDTFALRASGFTRVDPGYIDNVLTGEEDVNSTHAKGGRLSSLWNVSEDVSLKLAANYQHSELDGANFVDLVPGLNGLEQTRTRGTGQLEREAQFFTADLNAKLGEFEVTSLTGYGKDEYHSIADLGVALDGLRRNTKISQELRLTSPADQRFEWLGGLFYTHENAPSHSTLYTVDPATGAFATELFSLPFEMTLDEYAAFGDLTVHFTDQFDVQFGGRQSWIEQNYIQGVDEGRNSDTASTYMVTPRFKVSPDLMVYARIASGYRAGGPNTNVTLSGAPEGYKPDKTVNYEVGVKGEAFERKLTFEASIYRIDWNDLQLVVTPPSLLSYYTNAGKAKSQGVELSMQARPTRGLKLSSWVAYNDAKLAENFPAELTALGLAGVEGDRVPDSVEWSGHFSIDQDFAITDNVTSFVGGMVSYVGERLGVYVVSGSPRQQYPSYTQADLRAGVRFNDWNVNVFANNVTDKRAVLLGDPNLVTAVNYNQPRTVGVSFAKSF